MGISNLWKDHANWTDLSHKAFKLLYASETL